MVDGESKGRTIRKFASKTSWQRRKCQLKEDALRSTRALPPLLAPKKSPATKKVESYPELEDPMIEDQNDHEDDLLLGDDAAGPYEHLRLATESNEVESWDPVIQDSNAPVSGKQKDTSPNPEPVIIQSPWSGLESTMILDSFATYPVEILPEHQNMIHRCEFECFWGPGP